MTKILDKSEKGKYHVHSLLMSQQCEESKRREMIVALLPNITMLNGSPVIEEELDRAERARRELSSDTIKHSPLRINQPSM